MANDLEDKEKNPTQEDYEQKFGSSNGESGAASSSGQSDGDSPESANLSDREEAPEKDDGKSLNPAEQAENEGVGGSNYYDPGGSQQYHKPSMQNRIKGLFASRKRKAGWVGGGILGMLLGGFLMFFPVLGPLHVFSNLTDHNFGFNDSYRRNRTSRVVRSIFNNNRTNRSLRDTPFSLKADLVQFEKFETRMRSSGWSFDYNADGRAIGLIDPDGTRVNLENTTQRQFNRTIQPLLDDTMPAWRMNKRMRTRVLLSTFTGPRRSFVWSKLFGTEARQREADFEKRKFIKESGLEDSADTRRVQERTQSQDGDDVNRDTDRAGAVDEARDAVVDAKLNEGLSDADALESGRRTLQARLPGGTSITLGSVIVGCIAYAAYEQDLVGKFERYASAMRIGSTFMLATNEIQQGGDIDVGEVGLLFSEYNNEDGTFAESAAWQRATGSEVNGEELHADHHVIPPADSRTVVASIFEGVGGSVASLPFSSTVCGFVNSFVFEVIDWMVAGAEVIGACVFTGGIACPAAIARVATEEAFFFGLGRVLASSLTNFVGFLIEHPVQSAAFLDQSLNMISSEESRAAQPVDSEEYNAQLAKYKMERSNELPLTERYFALDNPNSLAAAFAKTKSSLTSTEPEQMFASLLNLPGSSLVAATTSRNVYAQADIDFDNYGFQKYSFNNEYLDVDPFEHAERVSDMIENDTEIAETADEVEGSRDLSRDFAVLCMGYDPQTQLVNKDTGTDMLPMFSDPEFLGEGEARRRNELFQALCIDEPSTSTQSNDLYAQVGRFVDDIELISSIIELTGEQVPPVRSSSGDGGGGGGGNGGSTEPVPEPNPGDPDCNPNNEICLQ